MNNQNIVSINTKNYNEIFKIKDGKKSYINFHNHTIYSDGEHSVKELLIDAKKLGITNISITDHDTLDAYIKGNAIKIAKELGINLTIGTEVTIKTPKNIKFQVHILLFFPEKLLNNPNFISEFNEKIGQNRGINLLKKRIIAINNNFGQEGINLNLEDFSHLDLNKITTAHSAKALEKKYPKLTQKEITRIIGKESPAYIKAGTDLETIINFKNKYNLVSIMAHPIREKEMKYTEEILKYIQKLIENKALDGLEMTHPELTNTSKKLLKNFNVKLHSAGSDTHNKENGRKILNYNVNSIFNTNYIKK